MISLFINWPFDQSNFMGGQSYNQSLIKEIGLNRRAEAIKAIFIGGSADYWTNRLILDTSGTLRKTFIFDNNVEFTVEITGNQIDESQLECWQSIGVNRLSIKATRFKGNMQIKKVLTQLNALLERVHNRITNINIDLNIGSFGFKKSDWVFFIQKICAMPITHVSLYADQVVDEEQFILQYNQAGSILREYGFEQYEFSHFAKPGFTSKYLEWCWDLKPIVGFGTQAVSYDGTTRFFNEQTIESYIESINKNGTALESTEQLTSIQLHFEKVMVGLRRSEGITWRRMLEDLNQDQQITCKKIISDLIKQQLIKENEGALSLTSHGLLLENQVLTKLIY